jgi:hypothetical protein
MSGLFPRCIAGPCRQHALALAGMEDMSMASTGRVVYVDEIPDLSTYRGRVVRLGQLYWANLEEIGYGG